MIARLAEYFAEQRVVAPFSLVADAVCGHKELEYKAGKVPWGNDIVKLCQPPFFLQTCLIGHVGFFVAVKLRVAFVVALAYNQHYLWTLYRTAVNLCFSYGIHEPVKLLCHQLVASY